MRLATFNILHGRSLADGRVDPERLARACATLGADVLALQEVDRDQSRSGMLDLTLAAAEGAGAGYWRFEPALVGTPGGRWRAAVDGEHGPGGGPGYGVGMVSRLPVTSWAAVRLPAARLKAPVVGPGGRLAWVADEPRVALCARVEAPFGPVTVATTHLSFVPGWNLVQLRRLVRALKRLPPPYVVLGDLNVVGRVPTLVTGWRSLVAARTYPAGRPSVQLDHVLASGDLPPVVGGHAVELPLSDHRAVVVDLAAAGQPG